MRAVVAVIPLGELAGQANGQLDPSLLVSIDDQGNRLAATPAAAWSRMAAAAAADGYDLTVDNAYRPLAVQEQLVYARYTTTPLAGRPSLWWRNARWWLLPGKDPAAVPGTSNHGWGRSVDLERGSRIAAMPWLEAHAVDHGWCWELPDTEPWHLTFYAGDTPPDPPSPQEDDDVNFSILPLDPRPHAEGIVERIWAPEDGRPAGTKRWSSVLIVGMSHPASPGRADVYFAGRAGVAYQLEWGQPLLLPVPTPGQMSVVGDDLIAEWHAAIL